MKTELGNATGSRRRRPILGWSVQAPYRLETKNWEFLTALGRRHRGRSLPELRDALRTLTGREHVFFAPSCRAAIAQVLSLLPQKEVVLPAYTCHVVKTAVQISGKRPIYVDISGKGLNATSAEFEEQAKPGRVLLPTHALGFSTDIEAICDLGRAHDCLTLEDAAAAFGARRDGRILGTFGDIGVFSFERSKRLPAFRGAAIVINNESILDPTRLEKSRIVMTTMKMPLLEMIFGMLHNAATVPWIYGRISLPILLSKSRAFEASAVPVGRGGRESQPLLFPGIPSLPSSARSRLFEKARPDPFANIGDRVQYRRHLEGTSIMTFQTPGGDDAALLRFPVAFPGRDRSEILRSAFKRGLFLDTNFEEPLCEPAERSRFPSRELGGQKHRPAPYSRSAISRRRGADLRRNQKSLNRMFTSQP